MKVTIRGKELDIDINNADTTDDVFVPVKKEQKSEIVLTETSSTVTSEDLDKVLSNIEFLDDLSEGDDDDKTAEN